MAVLLLNSTLTRIAMWLPYDMESRNRSESRLGSIYKMQKGSTPWMAVESKTCIAAQEG